MYQRLQRICYQKSLRRGGNQQAGNTTPTTTAETTTQAQTEAETEAEAEAVYDEVKEADVVIVGAGGAGLSAAIAAAAEGAESIIIPPQ